MTEPRLKPWSNGYLNIPDPADQVRCCPVCRVDFTDREPCDCWQPLPYEDGAA